MKTWKYTPLDAAMLTLSVGQFVTTLLLAAHWERSTPIGWLGSFVLLVFMMVYNIIVISHLFTHTPWFDSQLLNGLVSMLNSVNIGQSVQAYQLTHVRNHHRYSNDRKGPDGKTKDLSSTFQDGVGDEHATLFRYAFLGAVSTLLSVGRALLSVIRLWRVDEREPDLLRLASESPARRVKELRQVRLDRMAHFMAVCLFLAVSWKWTLICYLPAFYLALALVNVQNYFEHYGASPENNYANSVSYYGRLYNLLAFNDGYHQEHHLRPQAHWRDMPMVRRKYSDKLDQAERIISPVPAILGVFHRNREQLQRRRDAVPATSLQDSARDQNGFPEAGKRSLAHD
jgi:fatty acid desaturase